MVPIWQTAIIADPMDSHDTTALVPQTFLIFYIRFPAFVRPPFLY